MVLNESIVMLNTSQPLQIVMTSTSNWTQYLGTIITASLGLIVYIIILASSGAFSGSGLGSSIILKKINKITGKNILMIKHTEQGLFSQSMIDETSLRKISYILNKFEGKPFDLILHTPGGDIFSTLAISRIFQQYPGKIRAIIPLYSMSGGSMLALTCDELMMTRNASLGPIDPQLGNLFKFGSSRSWNEIVKMKGKKADDQTISFAMTGKQYTKTIKAHLLKVMDFGLSQKNKEKLAEFLTAGDIEHAYALTPLDLERFGIRATVLEDKRLLKLLEKIISSKRGEGITYYRRKK